MQAWWRVLRGVWPYRFQVVISMVCALGVGLSYASGVAVLLPVLKIFVSAEGVHGWADRCAAENRLDLTIMNRDQTVTQMDRDQANQPPGPGGARGAIRQFFPLIVTDAGSTAPRALVPQGGISQRILHVKGTINGVDVSSEAWLGTKDLPGMVDILAWADGGRPVELAVQNGRDPPQTVTVTPYDLSLPKRVFIALVRLLPNDPMQSLVWVVLVFVVLCILGSVFRYYQQFIGMKVANQVIMDLRRRMYDRVVQLPTSYFAQKGTSDLMSRLTQDTNTLTDGVGMALGKAVQEPVKALGALGLALWINWWLTLIVVFTMPVLGVIIRKFSKRMRRASKGALESWAGMLAVINETLIGVRVVKAYSAEGYERRRFARINKKLFNEQNRLSHYGSMSRPTVETLAVILSAFPMLFAAYLVLIIPPLLDREYFLVLMGCFIAMLEPLRKLADVNSKVQQSNAAATRVFEIVDMEAEPNHDNSLPKLLPHQRNVEFQDVTFNYPGHEEVVLKNVSLSVNRGQLVAIVGGNGSGKTTLVQLLPRLYVPTSGRILVDGQDIANVSLRSLRKQIGLVTQDTLLFADTIFNNIAYGTRHATVEQVMDAARRSYADEFIRGLTDGYETRVGEHGVRLSGGQKQRLAIARAILHDPAILIFDEAMSQIDSDSEMKISLALREFTQNRTTFMIAHRFSTVVTADLIVCLDAGRVVGSGTHQQLLNTCPPYRKLYENQFRDVVEAESPISPEPVDGKPAPIIQSVAP